MAMGPPAPVPSSSKSSKQTSPLSPIPLEGPDLKKLTPSCSRCRAKKLKCDTRQPCSNCIARHLDAECRKDERIPRGRKRVKLDAVSVQEEMRQLRQRMDELGELLPHLSPGPSSPTVPANGTHSKHQRPKLKHASSSMQTSYHESPSSSSADELDHAPYPRDTDQSVRALEKWADGEGPSTSSKDISTSAALVSKVRSELWRNDSVNPYWADPVNFQARIELSREAFALLPEPEVIEELVDVYFVRCNHLCGGILSETRFRRLAVIGRKSNLTTEEILISPAYIDPSSWSIMFMVLSIALCFYPYESDAASSRFHGVNKFRAEEGEVWTRNAHDLSRRALGLHGSLSLCSLPALQAATLLTFRAREPDAYTRQLLRLSIASAQALGYHQLGKLPLQDDDEIETRIRKEGITRLWAYLCCRDWCAAEKDGTYAIQPNQCTTRAPLHFSESDLLGGMTKSKPMTELTQMTYPLQMLALSKIIREAHDIRQASGQPLLSPATSDQFHKRLLRWLWALPLPLQIGSDIISPRTTATQRWMLHQQAFHQLLKLCRGDLSKHSVRASILDLADSILVTHRKVKAICPVLKNMWVNWMHLMNAAIIVGFDLLEAEEGKQKEPTARAAARQKIQTAMDAINGTSGSHRGAFLLEALLYTEEERHQRIQSGQAVDPIDFSALTLDLIRIAASKSTEPLWKLTDFTFPDRAHDSVMPALATNTLANDQCEAVRVDDWQKVAFELGLTSDFGFEPHENGGIDLLQLRGSNVNDEPPRMSLAHINTNNAASVYSPAYLNGSAEAASRGALPPSRLSLSSPQEGFSPSASGKFNSSYTTPGGAGEVSGGVNGSRGESFTSSGASANDDQAPTSASSGPRSPRSVVTAAGGVEPFGWREFGEKYPQQHSLYHVHYQLQQQQQQQHQSHHQDHSPSMDPVHSNQQGPYVSHMSAPSYPQEARQQLPHQQQTLQHLQHQPQQQHQQQQHQHQHQQAHNHFVGHPHPQHQHAPMQIHSHTLQHRHPHSQH
ncbi:hypothetical protein BCV69DRAFT_300599 [Microstroma glucosiphilum]|uniref:Zn(2)-C6 fungal-type domain-containing protein n=1 Tax=Pseudomicrostroma glucosiphilum TaxID=1684307 RepID=A0A316U244_9BASI|nr:hypothetical protein BCV69DRAFT_300599 [Pseudomicrostroma glucosiphilum]PWN19280.1 hypothetical protein BCV69DRAFT_300599 [Pseudomicrostroma glucosiphilum]